MLPLIQDTVSLLGTAFLALFLTLLAVIASAVIMRAIGIVVVE